MNLNYKIVLREEITMDQRKRMFELLESHYANALWLQFNTDLDEKRWVIFLICPQTGTMVGFSTQVLLEPVNNCQILFSGDTIIAREYWGSVALPVAFLELVNRIKQEHPCEKLYWMLISKGLRTYKFLSVFLSEYYPHHSLPIPADIKNMMNLAASKKFGQKFIPETGIIEAKANDQYLKEEYQPEEKKQNLAASYFFSANPGYAKGDELLCFAELNDENIHPFIKRVVKNYVG